MDEEFFIEKMLKEVKPKLKKAEIAAVSAINDRNHLGQMSLNAKINHPNVCKTGRNEDTSKALGIRNMTFVQAKASGFLVREESFDAHTSSIPMAGFCGKFKAGD